VTHLGVRWTEVSDKEQPILTGGVTLCFWCVAPNLVCGPYLTQGESRGEQLGSEVTQDRLTKGQQVSKTR